MADNIIATWQDAKNKGYAVPSSYNLSRCPTKQNLINANVGLSSEANSYSNTRLVPYSFIKSLSKLTIQGVSGFGYNGSGGITVNNEPIYDSWNPRSYGAYPSVNQTEAIAYLSNGTDTSIYRSEASQLLLFYPNDVSIRNLSVHTQWYFQESSGSKIFIEAIISAEYAVQFEGSSTTLVNIGDTYAVYPGSLIEVRIERDFISTMKDSRPALFTLMPHYESCRCRSLSSYSLRPSLENQEENIPEPIFVKEEDGKIYYKFSDYEETDSVEIPEILMEQEPEIHEYIDSSIGLKITVEIRHMPEYQNLET